MPLLIGPLAHDILRQRLCPQARPAPALVGHALRGGLRAGIDPDGWPWLAPGPGAVSLWHSDWTPELCRYADIMDLQPIEIAGRQILGVQPAPATSVAPEDGDWPGDLARAILDHVLAAPQTRPAAELRARLPRIADWAGARLRAAQETAALPDNGPAPSPQVQALTVTEPYAGFFSVEEHCLRHRRHDGTMSPPLHRSVFVSGDATVVLPWDPGRDRVLLIQQFRAAPMARGDRRPWLVETVAGRVDAGESPAEAALREAREEAGVTLSRLFAAPHHYPSPGAVAEFLYLYVGVADLPDDAAGVGGLPSEDEDIRSLLLPRTELTRMALAGEIRNGPLLALALWLELRHADLRQALDAP